MNRIKCATFDKDMQDSIPKEIRDKMEADRAKAEKEQETKAKTLPIQNVSNSLLDLDGKTIPVTFHVSKFEPKIDIDLSNDC